MDTGQIRAELLSRYASVADQPVGQFRYPVGYGSASQLGYPADFMQRIPPDIVDHFVGVGNPFSLGEPQPGCRVADIGCGCGFDTQIAAHFTGPTGEVVGVDMSSDMLRVAEAGLPASGLRNIIYVQASAEALPVITGWADLVISNGMLNLSTCKAAAFAEAARVLRPGGRFQAADLILVEALPQDLENSEFAWSS